ncbi:unnamed protein product [Haemonchus placei]|uniref:TPR_REGION domain-containing protein n=1 Tax=Haemonchus placei TaxID=6290 RepID=A0A0N4WHT4_HAEPC|nr:unnamed protein product [Haemonchus placei]
MVAQLESAESLKDAGNCALKRGEYSKANEYYTDALQLTNENDKELRAVLYRNRSLLRLKQNDFEGAESDATKAIEYNGADVKALYRRALAREHLGNVAAAFKDAKEALRLNPKDKSISELLQRLAIISNEKVEKTTSMDNRVKDMKVLAFEGSAKDKEQKLQAFNNLLVLSRESEAGAAKTWQMGKVVPALLGVAEDINETLEISVCAVRIVDELIKDHNRALYFLSMHDNDGFRSARRVCRLMCARDAKEYVNVAGSIIQRIFNALVKMDRANDIKPDPKVAEANKLWIIRVIVELEYMLKDKTVAAIALDNKTGMYKLKVYSFFNNLLARVINDPDGNEYRIKLAAYLMTLLQGPVDIGMKLIKNDRVNNVMLQMAESTNHLVQSIAAELIVMTVVDYEQATSTLKIGLPTLRKLYGSDDDAVKVRALAGLCKCAAAGSDDTSRATMKEGTSLELARACKKFLLDDEEYSTDVRRFACEGLSYLSLDADVKEWIVEDSLLLRALSCLAQSAGAHCVFALANIYVNLTNSYDKPEVDEELVKLAEFAQHHVPEVHPKDTVEFVEKRVRCLVEEGAVAACVAVGKTESHKALELIARAMLAFSEQEDLRGCIISEGGIKLCLRLTNGATATGKIMAAHAIAKLGANTDPQIAFPGQRACEVVKPLCELLHPHIVGELNYDALLTLTNLASISDSVRRRILKEKAIPRIEEFWFMTDHEHLRCAAAELLLNLLFLDDIYKATVEPGTDKLKLWVLYAAEENERLARAAAAAFAMLTENVDADRRIFAEIESWPEVLKKIAMHEDSEAQRRGLIGVANIMESDEKLCSEVVAVRHLSKIPSEL